MTLEITSIGLDLWVSPLMLILAACVWGVVSVVRVLFR